MEANAGLVAFLAESVPQQKREFPNALRVQKAKNERRQRKERENLGDVTVCSQIRL